MNLKTETGRSMVEMLGTLAIIGVLSIGGIAGYSYGMDKYRCNKTINDISLRTVDLITQASQGRTTLSLSEWDKESTIYDISNPAHGEGGLIKFDVGATNKIPQSVCEMLFDGLSNTVAQIDINGTTSTSNDSCGENNTMTFYFASGGNASAGTGGGTTGEQCGDTICGTCQKCDASTETCMTVGDYDLSCTIKGKMGWCISGTCQPDITCNCGPGQYCSYSNAGCYQSNSSDQCVDLAFKTENINGVTYYISDTQMTWWNSAAFCGALNKNMLSIDDLIQKYTSEENNPNNELEYTITIPDDICSWGETKRTQLGNILYEKVWGNSGNPEIWTKTLYEGDTCHPYYAELRTGCISDAFRDTYYAYAVCR